MTRVSGEEEGGESQPVGEGGCQQDIYRCLPPCREQGPRARTNHSDPPFKASMGLRHRRAQSAGKPGAGRAQHDWPGRLLSMRRAGVRVSSAAHLARYSQASSEQTVLSAGGGWRRAQPNRLRRGGHKKLAEPVDFASFRGTRRSAANQARRTAASSRDGQVGSSLPWRPRRPIS